MSRLSDVDHRSRYAPGFLEPYENPWIVQANDALTGLFRARDVLGRAVSHRNFQVAVCGISLFEEDLSHVIAQGVNYKATPTEVDDEHAEEVMLDTFRKFGGKVLGTVCIVGDVQTDDTSGLAAETCVPCAGRCVPLLKESPYITPETIFVSATRDLKTVQWYDLDTLMQAHETRDNDLLNTVHFDTPDLQDQDRWLLEVAVPIFDRTDHIVKDLNVHSQPGVVPRSS